MDEALLSWSIYEIAADSESLNGVMLRGRIRKFGIEHGFNVLTENTADAENRVRFAVLEQAHGEQVKEYVQEIISGASVELIQKDVVNPVLSKLQVNITERYKLYN